jgi:hypothetical protein
MTIVANLASTAAMRSGSVASISWRFASRLASRCCSFSLRTSCWYAPPTVMSPALACSHSSGAAALTRSAFAIVPVLTLASLAICTRVLCFTSGKLLSLVTTVFCSLGLPSVALRFAAPIAIKSCLLANANSIDHAVSRLRWPSARLRIHTRTWVSDSKSLFVVLNGSPCLRQMPYRLWAVDNRAVPYDNRV